MRNLVVNLYIKSNSPHNNQQHLTFSKLSFLSLAGLYNKSFYHILKKNFIFFLNIYWMRFSTTLTFATILKKINKIAIVSTSQSSISLITIF